MVLFYKQPHSAEYNTSSFIIKGRISHTYTVNLLKASKNSFFSVDSSNTKRSEMRGYIIIIKT